jgi:two-component system CheB/CheR fusion protein
MSVNTDDADLFGEITPTLGKGDDFLIVGLGASAGGIQALQSFFTHVPTDSNMSYVVILHMSPDHESRLAEVLQTTTSIPVTQVKGRVKVVPNHVYVISPNQSLAMHDGYLALSDVTRVEERRAPVDIFFRTLAESQRSRAVSVILSGTGANGSMGLKRVKEMGGVALVQSPTEAEFADMPRNAIATGLVDYVLPVAEIPAKIAGYRDRLGAVKIPIAPLERQESDEIALREIFTHLRVRTGHDFANYKRSTVLRRIERRISVHELADLPAYARLLKDDPAEAQALLRDLLISVTNFFRDPETFEYLAKKIIPKLIENKTAEDQIRVWVAGCATGEEAYSIAMLLAQVVADSIDAPSVQIFATDIDEWAITKAREGYYTINDAADVSPERLRRFFVKEGDGYRVRRELREMVLFANHNVIKDPPFSHLDLVTCRNLLIYLNRSAQERVMEILHFALNPGGYLFLGTSESIEGSDDLFVVFDKEQHIYRSRPVETRLTLPVPEMPTTLRQRPGLNIREQSQILRIPERLSYLDLHQRLLEQYAPPSVIVNEEYDVVHLTEGAGRYMQVGGGEPSNNLLRMIRPDLRLELRTALYQAVQNRTCVEARELPVAVEGQTEYINLIVRPVLREEDAIRGFILVIFEPTTGVEPAKDTVMATVALGEPIARSLEEELMRVRSQLRATIEQSELQNEELKASNEELQAMNEELRSAAEELETSKEELQSLNEELTTVNQELKVKIEEITQTNNNIQNLVNSTDIGTVFLDRSFRVRLFSPRTREIFNLIPADVGRSISDITSRLNDEELMNDIERVIERLNTVEREIQTQDSRWYLMRILPYRTADDRIEGVVITFLDITNRRKAEEALRQSEEQLRSVVDGVTEYAIISMDLAGIIQTWNLGAEKMFGYAPIEAIGESASIIFTPEDREAGIPGEEMNRARHDGRAPDERWHLRKDGTRFYVSGVLNLIGNPPTGFVKMARDLTKAKEIEQQLRDAHELLEEQVAERTRELAVSNESLRSEIAERIQTEKGRVRLLRRLIVAQEDERRRIARDIHDQLGQQMTALRLKLESATEQSAKSKVVRQTLQAAQEIAEKLDASVDFLSWELRPAGLDDLGLRLALANYVKEWSSFYGVPAEFHTSGLDDQHPAPEVSMNVYRITQEALNNVMKHAQAKHVDVLLERRNGTLVLIVEDDGVGFDLEQITSEHNQMGIIGMRERAALVGGSVEIESKANEGTTVFVRAPLSLTDDGWNESNEN